MDKKTNGWYYGLVHDGDNIYLKEIYGKNNRTKTAHSFCTPFLPDLAESDSATVKRIISDLKTFPFIWKTNSWSPDERFRVRHMTQHRVITELIALLRARLNPKNKKDSQLLNYLHELGKSLD